MATNLNRRPMTLLVPAGPTQRVNQQITFATGAKADPSGVRGKLVALANRLMETQNISVQLDPSAPDEVLGPQLDLILSMVGAGDLIEEDHSATGDGSGVGGMGVVIDQGALPMSTIPRRRSAPSAASTTRKSAFNLSTMDPKARGILAKECEAAIKRGDGDKLPASLRNLGALRMGTIAKQQMDIERQWGLAGK